MSKPNNILTKFKNMPVDGMTKTLFVAITLCLVCSMVVSFAAVNLKEVQEANKAIDKQINLKVVLNEWRIEAVTEGIDAIGDAIVKLEHEGNLVIGRGSDTDILVASAKAYIDGLNKLTNK